MKMLSLFKDTLSLVNYYTVCPLCKNDNNELVLVYHSIGESDYQNGRYKINLEPLLFHEQIKFLSNLKKLNIIITFDDGFENFFNIALPVLLKYNIKIILFITIGFIDSSMSFDTILNDKTNLEPLTWKQIREIADYGIEIGSHTLTHPNLSQLNSRAAYAEIVDSKKRIEDEIGKKVNYFAYPWGAKNTFNSRIKEIVKIGGYEKAYTNIMGFNTKDSDLYELRRIRIYSDDNIFRFKLKVNGAYNWVDYFNNFRLSNPSRYGLGSLRTQK